MRSLLTFLICHIVHHYHTFREKLQSRLDWLLKSINRSSETLKQIKEQQEGLDVNLGADIPAKKQESAEPLVATRIGDGGTKSQQGDLRSGNHSAGHRILALDDDSFQAISIDEMMSWYGEADGGGTCSEDFGNALINKWRGVKQQYCAASKPSGPAPSSIDCYLVRQTRHHGDGDNLCVMRNVAVNMGEYFNQFLSLLPLLLLFCLLLYPL